MSDNYIWTYFLHYEGSRLINGDDKEFDALVCKAMQSAFDILKSGAHDFDTWLSEFSGKFSGKLKDKFQFTDAETEVFYLCTWATKYVYKGCSLSIGDWASRMTPAFIESLDELAPHNETLSTGITPISEEIFKEAEKEKKHALKVCYHWLEEDLDEGGCIITNEQPAGCKATPIQILAIANHNKVKISTIDGGLSNALQYFLSDPYNVSPNGEEDTKAYNVLRLLNPDHSWNEVPPYEPFFDITQIVKDNLANYLEEVYNTQEVKDLLSNEEFQDYLKECRIL